MKLSFNPHKYLYLLTLLFSTSIIFAITNNNFKLTKALANQSQILTLVPVQKPIAPNEDLIFDINYSHSPALAVKTSGVSFRMHWNSSQLEYQSITNLLNDNFFKQSAIRIDNNDFDNDKETDVYIIFTWVDKNQQWPTVGNAPRLLTANFKTALGLYISNINLSSVSNLPDIPQQSGAPLVWDVKSESLTIDSENIFVGGFEVKMTPPIPSISNTTTTYLPQNIFSGDATLCSTDIDGNGKLEPLTDGVLASRFINGITGTTLTEGALGEGATRTTAAEIVAFLQMPDCQAMLDIDANGDIESGFDDVIFARYLFGYNGNDLTEDALGIDNQRDDFSDLNTWLEIHSYFRAVTMNEIVPVGTQIATSDGNIIVESIDNDINVIVTSGLDGDGDDVYSFDFDGPPGIVNLTVTGLTNKSVGTNCEPAETKSDYIVDDYLWSAKSCATFADAFDLDFNRTPSSRPYSPVNVDIYDGFKLKVKTSSQLTSSCSESITNTCKNKKPVLFIHGYSIDSGGDGEGFFKGLGGGKGTWGKFPELIEQLGFTPFEFRWRSASRFSDVALELVNAIKLIKEETGQEVVIIAHSFGGILTRTMLQGLAYSDPDTSNLVEKVVTIGTPHSGIQDSSGCISGKLFPKGQDSLKFAFCNQISCHQMGEFTLNDANGMLSNAEFFDAGYPGELIKNLACISSDFNGCTDYLNNPIEHPLENTQFLVLQGITADAFSPGEHEATRYDAESGDGLISYQGQRFLPQYTTTGTCETPVSDISILNQYDLNPGVILKEKMLGTSDLNIIPGDIDIALEPVNTGYTHSTPTVFKTDNHKKAEVFMPNKICQSINTCNHPTFIHVRDFLSPLNVEIEQALTQADPTDSNTVIFDVMFSKNINYNPLSFSINSFSVTPSGNVTSFEVDPNDNKLLKITVTNISAGDTITVSLPEGKIQDLYGNLNVLSTSNDNQVTYYAPLEVTVNQNILQSDPTFTNLAKFDVIFSRDIDIFSFTISDITLQGTSGTIHSLTGIDAKNWNLEVTGMTLGDTAKVSLLSGKAYDNFGFTNKQSTSIDNQVTFNTPLTNPLNDTGITWGGDFSSGNNATCISNISSPQDCHQGRDATHNDNSDGRAGFSFTKLDVNGNDLPANATSWSCVRDNVTRLAWEVKTDDSGIHDKDNTYRWGGITHQGSNYGTYFNDWDGLVNGTNNQSLCGFNDWRLPTTQELMNLVDSSSINQFIDVDYFPNNTSSYFWTASPYASSSSNAWSVNFNLGYSIQESRGALNHVRLVR